MAPVRAITALDGYVGHFVGVGERIFGNLCRSTTVLHPGPMATHLPIGKHSGTDGTSFTAGVFRSSR